MAFLIHCDAPNCTKSMELDDPAYGDWLDLSVDFVGSAWSNAQAPGNVVGHACKPAHAPEAMKWMLSMMGETPTQQQLNLEAEAKQMMAQPEPINMPPQPSLTNPKPQVKPEEVPEKEAKLPPKAAGTVKKAK